MARLGRLARGDRSQRRGLQGGEERVERLGHIAAKYEAWPLELEKCGRLACRSLKLLGRHQGVEMTGVAGASHEAAHDFCGISAAPDLAAPALQGACGARAQHRLEPRHV